MKDFLDEMKRLREESTETLAAIIDRANTELTLAPYQAARTLIDLAEITNRLRTIEYQNAQH